jgi:hypothetical protein
MVMPVPKPPFPDSTANAAMQVVTLHGNLSEDGRLSEVAILASSDTGMNEDAIEQANALGRPIIRQDQPGTTSPSTESMLMLEFFTRAR